MEINLGKFGTVQVWHKDMMGRLEDILILGNNARILKGKQPKKLDTFLRLRDTWEFIVKVHNENIKKDGSCIHEENLKQPMLNIVESETLRDLPCDNRGQIKYGDIFKSKVFNRTIEKRTRGKIEDRGIWANVYIMLDLAIWLDIDLKYEMYRVFIEEKILQHRDNGGNEFKELNILIDSLEQIPNKPDRYIHIAMLIRDKLKILENRGYNQKEHDAKVQQVREDIQKQAKTLIKMGMIKDYYQLRTFIINYPI